MNIMEAEFVMPYGKYIDCRLEDIPSGYIKWMVENIDDEIIQQKAEEEWEYREETKNHFWESGS